MERRVFPFSAIVGQAAAKQALTIALVNSASGGLLLSGPKGTAKSTLVRAAAPFTAAGRIVELPLGATDDMVFGSIDMEAALATGERRLRPGLLFRAAGTALYMDEVNLLRPDFLTAVLDSAANGFFELQRDGVSHQEEVSYTAIGTMNPEEGTLSASTLDRFGMFVSLENNENKDERAEIVRRVMAFEADGAGFREKYAGEDAALAAQIAAARALLAEVEASEAMLELTAQYCARAYCRGNRADLYLLEAACALAALAGRRYVMPQDIEAAAMFVLPHRMGQPQKSQPPEAEEPPKGEEPSDAADETKEDEGEAEEEPPEEDGGEAEDEEDSSEESEEKPEETPPEANGEGESDPSEEAAGNMDQVFAALESLLSPRLAIEHPPQWEHEKREGSGKRSLTRTDSRLGRYVRAEMPRAKKGIDLAFDATLRAAAPYQKNRRGTEAVIIRPEDYRSRVREKHIGANLIFLVDASGSMGAQERMKTVKGVILSLLKEAYQKRDRVGMIAFRRDRAEVLLPVTRSVDLAEKLLRELPTGGKTPLAEGLESTLSMIYGLSQRDKGQQTAVILITDGRANATYAGDDPVARALEAAEKFSRTNVMSVVLDTENDFLKVGIAPAIAKKMGAGYYTLKRLSSERVLRIVASLRG
ncbi:MAG: VWA domain-containing protein [Schwartzia sp. (in: firmicutes)]